MLGEIRAPTLPAGRPVRKDRPMAPPHKAPRRSHQTDADDAIQAVELSVPMDTLCAIIALARDVVAKTGSSVDRDDALPDDDPELDVLEDRGADPAEAELRTLVSDLAYEAQADLVALMWLGRDGGTWDELRRTAGRERTTPTADYLCGTPLLPEYLLSGLNLIGRECPEMDDLIQAGLDD